MKVNLVRKNNNQLIRVNRENQYLITLNKKRIILKLKSLYLNGKKSYSLNKKSIKVLFIHKDILKFNRILRIRHNKISIKLHKMSF